MTPLPEFQKMWRCVHSFRHNTGIGQTERWTDRQMDR